MLKIDFLSEKILSVKIGKYGLFLNAN